MRYLSLLEDGQIIDQIPLPPGLTEEHVIEIDEMLQRQHILYEGWEIAVTEDITT